MKIDMQFLEFKHWQDVYSRDSVTKELWNTIEENQRLRQEIENDNRIICDKNKEIYRLKEKLKRIKKGQK